ncbi:hypothetical protein ALP75_204397 [Pseudomonas syringae pv. actinidiae]|nr:hypothetical protein ALP75_204397 [Pseudomonas syringae pv. actinidiae]
MARGEGDQNAAGAVACDQRSIRAALHCRDLKHAGQTRRRAAQQATEQNQAVHRQADHQRGAHVAADHREGKALDAVAHQHIRQQTGDHARHQPPMHFKTVTDGADQVGIVQRRGRRFIQACRIAQRPFHQLPEQRQGDVGKQQAADRLIDPTALAHQATQADPQRAHGHCRQRHAGQHQSRRQVSQPQGGDRRGQCAEHQCAFAADNNQPGPCRQSDAERGQHQRRCALQGVLQREPGAKRAFADQLQCLPRRLALNRQKQPEQCARGKHCQQRWQSRQQRAGKTAQTCG